MFGRVHWCNAPPLFPSLRVAACATRTRRTTFPLDQRQDVTHVLPVCFLRLIVASVAGLVVFALCMTTLIILFGLSKPLPPWLEGWMGGLAFWVVPVAAGSLSAWGTYRRVR